jgi:hypothetical protein
MFTLPTRLRRLFRPRLLGLPSVPLLFIPDSRKDFK